MPKLMIIHRRRAIVGCGGKAETITHIISQWSKLVEKEYKNIYDWVGKVIHWELCEK